MPKLLLNILISAVVTLVAVNVPSNWIDLSKYFSHPRFGAAFTQLSAGNTVSSFPTTYNNNLNITANTSLANTFIGLQSLSNATSTQFTCSGPCWFGSANQSSFAATGALTLGTALTVPNGGTGSTTLSTGQVLLGNAAGNIGVVSGYGNSGQSLISNGTGLSPTWQSGSFDNTLNYVNTGTWAFNGSATDIKSLNASSTVIINNVTYNFTASQGGAQTVLQNDGSGNLYWGTATTGLMYLNTSPTQLLNTTASTTIFSTTLAGNALGTGNVVKLELPITDMCGNAQTLLLTFGYNYSTTTMKVVCTANAPAGKLEIYLNANGSTGSQYVVINLIAEDNTAIGDVQNQVVTKTLSVDSTTAHNISMIAALKTNASGSFTATEVLGQLLR